MTLLQMRYFQSVFESQSVSRSAIALNVSQPTISKAIQTLEWELGIQLFVRVRKHIAPTDAARFFYEESKRIVLLFDQLQVDMQNYQTKNNTVNIGIGSLSNILLSASIQSFAVPNRDVSLHLAEMGHQRNMEMLKAGKVDLFIDGDNSLDFMEYPSFRYITLSQSRLFFCVNKASPFADMPTVTPNQIGRYPIIVLDSDSTKDTLPARIFSAEHLKANIVLQTNQMSVIESLLKNNLAGVFLLDSIIPSKSYIHKIPLASEVIVNIRLVWNSQNLSKSAALFVAHMQKSIT